MNYSKPKQGVMSVDCVVSYSTKYPGQSDMNFATYYTGVYATHLASMSKIEKEGIVENLSSFIDESAGSLKKYVDLINNEVKQLPVDHLYQIASIAGINEKTLCEEIDAEFRPMLLKVFSPLSGPVREEVAKVINGNLMSNFYDKTYVNNSKWWLFLILAIILILIAIFAFFFMM